MKKLLLILILLITISGCQPGTQPVETIDNNIIEENQMTTKIAEIHTNKGIMTFELFTEKAPITTENFINLSNKGFYENVIFHRVIQDFMIQGGDPTGTGRGGPGYTIQDEFHPELRHDSIGILSMANAGPNTGGSQFFITLVPTPWLDNRHSVFGNLKSGEDVLRAIGDVETDQADRPLENVFIEKIVIK